MIPDDVETCLRAIKARWPYQPMSEDETKAWRRHLRQTDLVDFGAALDIVVDNGGSLTASSPGMRPSVAEFAATVRSQSQLRLRREDQARLAQEFDTEDITPPESVPDRVAALRERLAARGVRA